jgi:glutamate-1-semialdehyde 2,1-aminomutase
MCTISKTERSKQLFERARKSLLGGVASLLQKSPYDEYPIFLESGKGSKLYDVDGNEYIDYSGAFGPMILGYCHPALEKAVTEQIAKGSHFGAPYELLAEVSEKITKIIPCADLVTYPSTGTEASMFAFRLARAHTGKNKIVKFEGHYHGRADEQMVSYAADSLKMMGPRNRPWKTMGSAGQSEKALEDIIVLPWNDLEILGKEIKRQKHEIAAVITEPIMLNCEPVFPKEGFLEGLRRVTEENEILLIFDEVITGFRLALGGAQEYYQVTPDISSFGKAVAGGFQLAGVAAKREIMESGVHYGGTFNGNPIAVAACNATIRELEKPGLYGNMAKLTDKLTEGINEIARNNNVALYCRGIESIWQIAFGIKEAMTDFRDNFKVDKMTYQRLRKGCLEKGIMLQHLRGRNYLSAAHTDEDIDKTLSVIEEVLWGIAKH